MEYHLLASIKQKRILKGSRAVKSQGADLTREEGKRPLRLQGSGQAANILTGVGGRRRLQVAPC